MRVRRSRRVPSSEYSKQEIESRKKLGEKVSKLDTALGAVFTEPTPDNYGKLKQAVEKANK